MLRLDRSTCALTRDAAYRFHPADRRWEAVSGTPVGEPVNVADAVRWLQRESGSPLRIPVGVIGPAKPTLSSSSRRRRSAEVSPGWDCRSSAVADKE